MKRFYLVILLALTTIQSASAQSSDELSTDVVWYAGGSIGQAFENFSDTGGTDIDESIVLGAQIGVRARISDVAVQPALDLKFRWFDEFDFKDTGDLDGWTIGLRPKLYFGSGVARPYVFAGFGWMDAGFDAEGGGGSSADDFYSEFGLGVEFTVGRLEGFFIEADYLLPFGDVSDFEIIELSLGYNFAFSMSENVSTKEEPRQYIGFSIASAIEDFHGDSGVSYDDSLVIGGQLGFRFKVQSEAIQPALDLKVRYYDGFDIDVNGVGEVGELDGWAVTLRPKMYIGTHVLRPYLFAGAGWMDVDISNNETGDSGDDDLVLEIGAGVELATERLRGFFFEVDYLTPQGDLSDYDMIEVGFGYNFHF